MTKETLKGLGLTDEQVEAVWKGLDGNFVTKARFDEVNTELTGTKATIKDRDKQLETLKSSAGDSEGLKKQIADLQTENKTKDETHAAEVKKMKLDNAVEKALSGAKAKSVKAVRAELSDFLASAEVGDDGAVKGLDAELRKLVESEATSFLFDAAKETKPKIAGASPAGTVTTSPDPKAEGFETRLAEARKANDNLAAVSIKREAAAEGIILM